jgi:CHASE3 domain sensor protein
MHPVNASDGKDSLVMDLNSVENSMIVRMAAGAAAIAICLAIGFRSALSLSLGKIVTSLTRGITVVEKVDDIVNDLDRLRVSQRAFLDTGEDPFAQGVIESATGLIENVAVLKQLTAPSAALARQIARVSHSVDWALELVGESNDLQHYFGTAAAVTLLDEDGDRTIESAETDAIQLKKLATSHVLDRVRTEGRLRSILNVVF